jgi:hypothetical protein
VRDRALSMDGRHQQIAGPVDCGKWLMSCCCGGMRVVHLLFVAPLLVGCEVADATSYVDLSSYGHGTVTVRRNSVMLSADTPDRTVGVSAELVHASDEAGECPGLDTGAVQGNLSGLQGRWTQPGGRRLFVDGSRCFRAFISFHQTTDPNDTTGHLVLSDASKRIEIDVDRLLAPVVFDPAPSQLTSISRGRSLALHVPGFAAADFDTEFAGGGHFSLFGDSIEGLVRLEHRLVGDAWEVQIPSDLAPGSGYKLLATVYVRMNVTRCEGVPNCEVAPTNLQAEYGLVLE